MSNSILSNEKECYCCATTLNLHRHHIFYGMANRKLSEKDGCWVYLCASHHNMGTYGVHNGNRRLDVLLKKECQERWEAIYGTREEFIKRYGKSYL